MIYQIVTSEQKIHEIINKLPKKLIDDDAKPVVCQSITEHNQIFDSCFAHIGYDIHGTIVALSIGVYMAASREVILTNIMVATTEHELINLIIDLKKYLTKHVNEIRMVVAKEKFPAFDYVLEATGFHEHLNGGPTWINPPKNSRVFLYIKEFGSNDNQKYSYLFDPHTYGSKWDENLGKIGEW